MSDDKRDDRNEKFEEVEVDEFEDTDIGVGEVKVNDKLKKLREKLRVCDEEKRQYLEDLQRTKADFLNARRRLEEERARDKERVINNVIDDLLPLCDSFYLAMKNATVWESVSKDWRLGIEGIKNQLDSILSRYQVSPIDPTGENFDPIRHEAVSNVPVESPEQDHLIVEVIQLGYERKINDEVVTIRPARVIVGQYQSN